MNFLFFFLDGVGLGKADPEINPLAAAVMPNLERLLEGQRLLANSVPFEGEQATLLALDAGLGVAGLPQSATGQASLLTGINVPKAIGYHYGPKPDPAVASYLKNGTLFNYLRQAGYQAALLNAYPPRYFTAIQSRRRIYSAIPLAVTSAGLPLKTSADLAARQAISADLTARGWRESLGITHMPELEPAQAGRLMATLAQGLDFAFFDYWLSDYAGHHQDRAAALELLETIDVVLGGLLEAWDQQRGLILFTSDHGNLENLSTRRHTDVPVPALVVGSQELRRRFCGSAGAWQLQSLVDIAPAIRKLYE